ncbi:hypothetical protein QV65_02380, partial [Rhodococcus erythropolis]
MVNLVLSVSRYASAARTATAWLVESGRPNCTRSEVYFAVIASASSQTPVARAARATRARRNVQSRTTAPSAGSASAAVTATPSNCTELLLSRFVTASGVRTSASRSVGTIMTLTLPS